MFIELLEQVRAYFDPQGIMNSGVMDLAPATPRTGSRGCTGVGRVLCDPFAAPWTSALVLASAALIGGAVYFKTTRS